MTDRRPYPDESPGEFPRPPQSFTDREGRVIEVVAAETTALEDLVGMYLDFDPGDRAQGIPPVGEKPIREWLETLFDQGPINVLAYHVTGDSGNGDGDEDGDAGEGTAVGHATLVPDGEGAYELAVFVLSDYQDAGIGTRLLETLLGRGQSQGVERVWLTVERWNEPAISLYRKLGFEATDAESFELEMSIRLD